MVELEPYTSFEIEHFKITPVSTSHDVRNPLGFIIENSEEKLVYLTDSGKITISGTADNILNADGDKAVQEGDSGTETLTFTDPSSGATSPIPVTIEVKKAGQTDVTAT